MSSILKYNDQILKHNDQILSVSSSTPTPCPSCGWTYPSDWPSIYEEGDGKLVFLFRDVSTLFGFYAVTANSGDYTINWGDGNVEDVGSSTLVTHSYAPGGGTPCSEGYTTYKCVITTSGDTFTYFRFYSNLINHFETLVPVLAAYSELDLQNFTDFSYMFRQATSSSVSGGVYCPYLKSVKFKDSTNSITNVTYMLGDCPELEELVMPTIDWTSVTSLGFFLVAPKLTFSIPTTFGSTTGFLNPFVCISDASELNFTGLSNVTGAFANTGATGIKKISIDDATGITSFSFAFEELEELTLPTSAPACTNFTLSNTSLQDITIPSLSSSGANINIQNNLCLKNITFTATPATGVLVYSNTALETANFDVLTTSTARVFRLTNNDSLLDVSINGLCSQLLIGVQSGDTYANNVTRSVLVNSTAGQFVQHCYVRYCNLDETALNALFTSLPTVSAKTIYIKGNPGIGVGGYDATIATAKGWAVNTTT